MMSRRSTSSLDGGDRMTIYEKLFGTPERAAKTLDALAVGQLEVCWLMDELCSDKEKKCELCRYEYDHYGCEDVGVTCIDWLTREVVE